MAGLNSYELFSRTPLRASLTGAEAVAVRIALIESKDWDAVTDDVLKIAAELYNVQITEPLDPIKRDEIIQIMKKDPSLR